MYNCVRLIYLEHAIKFNSLEKSIMLSNCFLNRYSIKSKYDYKLECEIDKYCPVLFKNEIRVPEFYMNMIKSKVK